MKLTDKIKILFGKQLTQEQIEASKKGIEKYGLLAIPMEEYNGAIDNIFRKEGKIMRKMATYNHSTQRAASHGAKIMNTLYYLVRLDKREYDMEGKLTRKEVEIPIEGCIFERKIVSYNPPGKLFGTFVSSTQFAKISDVEERTVDKYNRHMYAAQGLMRKDE